MWIVVGFSFLGGCAGSLGVADGGTVTSMGYPSDVTDAQWELLFPLLSPSSKRGPKHADLRTVVNAIRYVARTGCQWRYLPADYGTWTRVWSQFRRWARNGTWPRLLTALHRHARVAAGREPFPSVVAVDTHLARGASNGGVTFHTQGGPYGATNGAKRAIAVDVTGLPVAAAVLPASVHENSALHLLLSRLGNTSRRLTTVLTDQGVTAAGARKASAAHQVEVRRLAKPPGAAGFVPWPLAWRVETAHGRLLRHRRLARSFENTTASAGGWLHAACVADVLAVTV